jgi:hypothetical protein
MLRKLGFVPKPQVALQIGDRRHQERETRSGRWGATWRDVLLVAFFEVFSKKG